MEISQSSMAPGNIPPSQVQATKATIRSFTHALSRAANQDLRNERALKHDEEIGRHINNIVTNLLNLTQGKDEKDLITFIKNAAIGRTYSSAPTMRTMNELLNEADQELSTDRKEWAGGADIKDTREEVDRGEIVRMAQEEIQTNQDRLVPYADLITRVVLTELHNKRSRRS